MAYNGNEGITVNLDTRWSWLSVNALIISLLAEEHPERIV